MTAPEFRDFFDRGQFDYGATPPQVRTKDIDQAIAQASATYNEALYPTDEIRESALAYLSAHFLQEALDGFAASGMLQSSRGADGLNESFAVPEWLKESELGIYATTPYGRRWLLLTAPYLNGAVYAVKGTTQP